MSLHPLYEVLESLKELNMMDDYWSGIESMGKLLENVKNNPLDERFRRFAVDDPFFNKRIGFLMGSEKLMEASGFLIDDVGAKEFYYMHATEESWEELLTVSAILQSVLSEKDAEKSERKGRQRSVARTHSSERVIEMMPSRDKSEERKPPPRSPSRRKSQPKASSDSVDCTKSPSNKKSKASKSGKPKRRYSNDDSVGTPSPNDDGESIFLDESFDNEHISSPGQAVAKKKKKKKRPASTTSTDRAHDEISKAGGYMGEDGAGASPEGKRRKKKKKKKKKSDAIGSSSSISSVSSWDERMKKFGEGSAQSGDYNSGEEAVFTTDEDVPPNKTATKDYWKNSSTQALVAARMRNEEPNSKKNWALLKNATLATTKSKAGSSYNSEPDNASTIGSTKAFGKMVSRTSLRRLSLGGRSRERSDDEDEDSDGNGSSGMVKIDAMHKLKDGASKDRSSRLTDKTVSMRSMGSSSVRSRTSSRRQQRLERGESRVSTKDLERGLSISEITELRKMTQEQKELRELRKKRLMEHIKKETGPRWSLLMLSVTMITAAELGLDLGSTIISFVKLLESFECCGNELDASGITLGVTIPYFSLIMVELVLLIFSVRNARTNSARDAARIKRIEDEDEDLDFFDDEDSLDSDWDDDEEDEEHSIVPPRLFLGFSFAILSWDVLSRGFCCMRWGVKGRPF